MNPPATHTTETAVRADGVTHTQIADAPHITADELGKHVFARTPPPRRGGAQHTPPNPPRCTW